MKSDEIIQKVETEAVKAEGWLKGLWNKIWPWVKSTSWKTRAVLGVILVVLIFVICGYTPSVPHYVTRSDAQSAITNLKTLIAQTAAKAKSDNDALSAKVNAVSDAMKSINGKMDKSAVRFTTARRPVAKKKKATVKVSGSSWLDF